MRHSKHVRKAALPPFVDPVFAEGLSPRRHSGGSFDRQSDRKAQQLCRQVERALSLTLTGECGDDLLRELFVESVVPAPDTSRLLVRVRVPADVAAGGLADVMERLTRAQGVLRRSVAAAICRKRVPELTFVPIGPHPHEEVTP